MMIDIILPFIESEEMREYLRSELSEVSLYQAINVITASRASLEDKGSALRRVADEIEAVKDTLDEDDKDDVDTLHDLIRAADFALNEITENTPTGTVFLLAGYFEIRLDFAIPFTSFESARRHLLKDAEEFYDEVSLKSYEIEKWVPVSDGELQLRVSWTLSHEGVIWFPTINPKVNSYLEELYDITFLYLQGGLCNIHDISWLPIPFTVGDIITVDCRPERDIVHAVITETGDNKDCCAVQAVYMTVDGKMNISALKHDLSSPNMFTCLLRLAKFEGELPVNEVPLQKASEMLKQDPALGLLDKEDFFGRMGFKKEPKGHGFVPEHTEVK